MNKKYVYLYVVLMVQHAWFFGSEQSIYHDPAVLNADEYIPETFSKQIAYIHDNIKFQIGALGKFFKNQDDGYMNQQQPVVEQEITQVDHNTQHIKLVGEQKQQHLDILKPYVSEMNFTTYQKQILAGVLASVVVAGIVYTYKKCFAIKNLEITAQRIQKIIESIMRNNTAISKQDQLHKIFEVLMSNGFEDIVVYNDQTFVINNQFKVEIKGNIVKVSC